MSEARDDAESRRCADSGPALVLLQAAAAQAGIGSFARRGLETPQTAVSRYRATARLMRWTGTTGRR